MMATMTTTAAHQPRSTAAPAAEQLTLLPEPTAPARFRLSRDTRERGLRHVAEIRQMLAERSTQRVADLGPASRPTPQHSRAA